MPRQSPHAIDTLGILAMDRAQHPMETLGGLRYRDEVHVIRHEAIRDYLHAIAFGMNFQQSEVGHLIRGAEEDRLAVVAALGEVVRNTRDQNSGATRHIAEFARPR